LRNQEDLAQVDDSVEHENASGPFTTTGRMKFVKPPYTFVYFAKGGEVKKIDGVDLSKAVISSAIIGKRDQQLISLDSNSITRGEAILGNVAGSVRMPFILGRYVNLGSFPIDIAQSKLDDITCPKSQARKQK